MARYASTGILQLHYVASISNAAAPTAAEIAAGSNLTAFLRRDGLTTPLDGSTIDGADVASAYNKTGSGSFGGQPISATFYRNKGADTAYDALPRGTTGYWVISREVPAAGAGGTLAAADRVEVWPIDVISRSMMDIADNEYQKFVVTCAVPDAPNIDVAVA
jgi:hypothetical protein